MMLEKKTRIRIVFILLFTVALMLGMTVTTRAAVPHLHDGVTFDTPISSFDDLG